jgi:hypothetical protein
MGFINIGVYSARAGKEDDLKSVLKKIFQYMNGNSDKFAVLKSRKLYTRCMGGVFGEYVDMWEFGSWKEKSILADKEYFYSSNNVRGLPFRKGFRNRIVGGLEEEDCTSITLVPYLRWCHSYAPECNYHPFSHPEN